MKKKKKNAQRSPKRRRSQKKRTYRTRNWKKYNAALVARGSLTVWVEPEVFLSWCNKQLSGRRGASLTYNDVAILTALTLKVVYRLPLRATQGLLCSLLRLMGAAHLPVPDYSTLCRRQKTLKVALPHQPQALKGQALHLVVDSTGCKIYGEGEWKVRQHGYSKRRTWRKLHIGVNEATGEILAAVLTTNDVSDSAVLPDLLEQIDQPLSQMSGDGGYDKRPCYEVLRKRQIEQASGEKSGEKSGEEPEGKLRVTIPPRHGARIWQHGNRKAECLARDENLRRIRQIGRARWKSESGYHRRSLVETTMFRLKSLFGDKLSARSLQAQATESFIRCAVLNQMTSLGMPDSYAV